MVSIFITVEGEQGDDVLVYLHLVRDNLTPAVWDSKWLRLKPIYDAISKALWSFVESNESIDAVVRGDVPWDRFVAADRTQMETYLTVDH